MLINISFHDIAPHPNLSIRLLMPPPCFVAVFFLHTSQLSPAPNPPVLATDSSLIYLKHNFISMKTKKSDEKIKINKTGTGAIWIYGIKSRLSTVTTKLGKREIIYIKCKLVLPFFSFTCQAKKTKKYKINKTNQIMNSSKERFAAFSEIFLIHTQLIVVMHFVFSRKHFKW